MRPTPFARRHLAVAAGLVVAAVTGETAQARAFAVLRAPAQAWMIIDPAAIERDSAGPVRRMWTVTVQRNILNETPPQPGYVRALNEYDCAAQKTRWKTFTAFSRAGTPLVSRDNRDPAWIDVPTVGGAMGEWRVACGYSSGDSTVEAESVAKVVIALMRAWDPPAAAAVPVRPKPVLAVKPKPAAKPKRQGAERRRP